MPPPARQRWGCLVLLYHAAIIGIPAWCFFKAPAWFPTALLWSAIVACIPLGMEIARHKHFPLAFLADYLILAALFGAWWSWHDPGHRQPLEVVTASWVRCMADSPATTTEYYGPADKAPSPCLSPEPAASSRPLPSAANGAAAQARATSCEASGLGDCGKRELLYQCLKTGQDYNTCASAAGLPRLP